MLYLPCGERCCTVETETSVQKFRGLIFSARASSPLLVDHTVHRHVADITAFILLRSAKIAVSNVATST